jgi:3-hydroxyisobutyrate dehydrogenase-like beta-hydroxyacid dehydrogenase
MPIIVKDVGIVMDEARLNLFPAPLCAVAEQVFTAAMGAGLAKEDDGNVIKLWERFGVPSSIDQGAEADDVENARELVVQPGERPSKVLFVGLGAMGLPMALRLVKEGLSVVGYDTSSQAVQSFQAGGGKVAQDLKAEAGDASVVVFATNNIEQAEEVLLGSGGLAQGEWICTLLVG